MDALTQIPAKEYYRGYTIQKEFDPWALQYGMNYRYFIDGERIYSASTIEEAKNEIDEREPGIIVSQKPYDINTLFI